MAHVLIQNSNSVLTDLLNENFKNYLNCEVLHKDSYDDLINMFYLLPDIDVVITSSDMGDGKSVIDLINFLEKKSFKAQIIVLGPCDNTIVAHKRVHHVQNELEWNQTIQIAAKIFDQEIKEITRNSNEFISEDLKTFLKLGSTCVDVFIRLGKDSSNNQFVKRIHAGDSFSQEVIERYMGEGLTHFYIRKEDEDTFNNFISNKFVSKLEGTPLVPIEEKIQALAEGFELALSEIIEKGFSSATIQMTESLIISMDQIIKAHPSMTPLLHKVINSKSTYIYKHSHMTSIVASHCLKHLIDSGEEDYLKLTYASLFQNASLIERDFLARITSKHEVSVSNLNDDDLDAVELHALESVNLIRDNPDLPLGVDEIIKCHHGASDGIGFEKSDYEKINDLSKVFMLSCEFAKLLLDVKSKKIKSSDIMHLLKKRFQGPIMLPYIRALENSLQAPKAK